mmetsp:Transcript_93966/g.265933  ORF Transcript_93966/g.265933 Transcript_93966/m.265933 type:complete len:304 (+) Transcript_93966:1272-2183(+)
MVHLCQDGTLSPHFIRDHPVLLADALQSISLARGCVLHQSHGTERTPANEPHVLQTLEPEAGVLETDSLHQLLAHGLRDYLPEGAPVKGPKLRSSVTRHLDSGTSGIVQEQCALAEARALAQDADGGHHHAHFPAGNHIKGTAHLASAENLRAFLILAQHQRVHEAVDLFVGELVEHGHLPREQRLPHVLNDRLLAHADGRKAQVLERVRQVLPAEHRQPAARAAGAEALETGAAAGRALALEPQQVRVLAPLAAPQRLGPALAVEDLSPQDDEEPQSTVDLGTWFEVLDLHGLDNALVVSKG